MRPFPSPSLSQGELARNAKYKFAFNNVEKPHETYMGINACLRSVPRPDAHSWHMSPAAHPLPLSPRPPGTLCE